MAYLFSQFLNMIYEGIAGWVLDLSKYSINIFSNDVVNKLLDFFQDIGWIIYGVGILFGIANFCISRNEDGIMAFEDLFKGILSGMLACYFIRPGAIFIFTIADTIASAIKSSLDFTSKDSVDLFVKNLKTDTTKYSLFFSIVLTVVFIVLLTVIFVQCIKRSGLYVMQIMVGYLYIFNMPAANYEGIFDWCRQTVALAATNVLQMTCLFMIIHLIITGDFMAAFGFLFAASSAEKLASRFGMSVGSRDTVGAAFRGVSSTVQFTSSVAKFAA